ncbi:unnamed protein product [Owenia fusiformis]|uniref:Uncharacterized protein n=1 Tax=Owenia fusiformis TaxID=6347 RepID=A0A8S4Q3A9_OWEFU|nr:unnamed protein product [Owenia fusiformis]
MPFPLFCVLISKIQLDIECPEEPWSEWSCETCRCGIGKITCKRTRELRKYGPNTNGEICKEVLNIQRDSKEEKCEPRCCSWDDWTNWKSDGCSKTCGRGTESQTRTRVKIYGRNGNSQRCRGESKQTRTQVCNIRSCASCEWSSWSRWSPRNGGSGGRCPVTCGGGTINIYRTRRKIFSTGGSSPDCPGNSEERDTQLCNTQGCRTCLWSTWTQWVSGSCSVTCGSGSETQTRSRTKLWGTSSAGSPDCFGSVIGSRIVTCTRDPCRGCRWTDWGLWVNDPCPVPCGGGTSTSIRRRTKLTNVIGGARSCPGLDFEIRASSCNTNQCCEWSRWSRWSPRNGGSGGRCPITCGGGRINVYRTRTKIFGSGGSSPDCPGVTEERESQLCNTQRCPTCLWSNWGQWAPGLCSVTCGSGSETQTRSRSKVWGSDPEGSSDCFGSPIGSRIVSCIRNPCRGCRWTDWSVWVDEPCPVTCGGGTSTSTRRRTKLTNVIGGARSCPGLDFEIRASSCNTNQCCEWSRWSRWSPRNGGSGGRCPVTCGGGRINVYRTRTKIFGSGGRSSDCPGVSEERDSQSCNTQRCHTCLWSNWGQWAPGLCSVTCGSGSETQTRSRSKDVDGLIGAYGSMTLAQLLVVEEFPLVPEEGQN